MMLFGVPMNMARSFVFGVVLVLLLDQLTKYWALHSLFATSDQIRLLSFFWLTPVWNSGISFGLFSDQAMLVKGVIPLFAILVVIWLYMQLPSVESGQRVAASLIAGGALGNVIDRIRFGRVIDFLDFHLFNYHWPAFNIADSAIFIGVVLWLYGIMRTPKQEDDQND